MTSKPKLGLPGFKPAAPAQSVTLTDDDGTPAKLRPSPAAPPRLPDNAKETLSLIALQELERHDYNKSAAFQSGLVRIVKDEALFRRIAMGLIKASYGKRLKNHCRVHSAMLANKKAPA